MNAPLDTPGGLGIEAFLLSHKGDVTLAFSALVYLASWMLLRFTPWRVTAEVGVSMAEAALIGGLCDYIALKMIFERRWYLPNSGVLPRNRAKLVDGIAATIENEWLTPQMIGKRLSEMELVERLGAYLEEVKVEELLGREGFERLVMRVVEYLESPEMPHRVDRLVEQALPKSSGRINALIARYGLKRASAALAASLRKRLPQLRNDSELMTSIEGAIHELGEQLREPSSAVREFADDLVDRAVRRAVEASRGEITRLVRDNLSKLTDDQIRIQIESKTRTHLVWIRVNGGIFGALFGLMFAMSRIVAHHGPEIAKLLGM